MSYNTIIPTSYLRDVPMLFLEARIHGSAKELVSQMGISMNTTQCDVGLMTRTSGVFIIAGVSSYCAYKLCGKLLGRRFVWRLLDSHPLNVTPQTTFISSNSTLFEAPDQLYCQLLSSDNEKESDDEECVTLFPDNESPLKGAKKYHVDLTSPASDLRRKGLAALSIVDSDEFGKGVSILDRPVKGIALKENVNSKYAVSNSACSEHDNGSVKSAAFNLTWDTEPLWDDEFFGLSPKSHIQNKIERIEEDGIRSTTSSAFIFSTLLNDKDDGDSIFKATSCSVHESEKEDEIMVSENNSITMEDLSSIINSKCMNDSQHLYRSVIVATSDAAKSMSICSSKSNISKINERFLRKNNGLMELTPASCSNNLEPSPMTDSCISKISFTSSSAVSKPHLTPTTQPSPTNVMNRNSIGSTLPARVINNFTGSIAGKSMQSLEWCDETFEEGSSVNNSWDQEEGLFNLGVDHSTYYPRQNVGSSSDTYSETSKYSEPPKTQALTIPSKLPEPLHLPHSSVDLRLTGTRDLMVVIREHFKSAETTKLKLANMIYGKKRLRRVKESDSKYRNLTFDGFLQASLHAMLFSNAPFFNCSSFEVIEKVS
uniref:Protein kinase domain-containing protein n=1 Tax=Rhabditophanes sp. KR3021 TaxID=114890 RepID=A0AC35TLB2_9BILA